MVAFVFCYLCRMMEEEVSRVLKLHSLKNTKLRRAVLSKLMQETTGFSHQELSTVLEVSFDRVSLFRTLTAFEEAGVIHKIIDLNGTARYAYSSTAGTEEEHAHFLCRRCGRVICLDNAPSLSDISVPDGFQKQVLDVKVEGICPECGSKATSVKTNSIIQK